MSSKGSEAFAGAPSRLGRYRPLWVDKAGALWAGRGTALHYSEDGGNTFRFLAGYAAPLPERVAAHSRLGTRLLRAGFHGLIVLEDGSAVAVVRRKIIRLRAGATAFEPAFDIPRGSRPLRLCAGPDGAIYFGEYFDNPNRDEVHIYASPDRGITWDVCYTFGRREIRHIHGVFHDPHRKGYWVLTGDEGDECRILFTEDFGSMETVATGTQQCRAVSVLPLPDGLVVPMDTPFETNYIQWLDVEKGSFTRLCSVPNSVFFTARANDFMVIATAVEPSAANPDRFSYLYCSPDGRKWEPFYKQKKDPWSSYYFAYGLFHLPNGPLGGDHLYASGYAVSGDDGQLLRWDLKSLKKAA